MCWFDHRIYAVCFNSDRIFVFHDQLPFDRMEEEEFDMEEMQLPEDMTACRSRPFLFISDPDDNSRCLWRIEIPSKLVTRQKIDGKPLGLSITASDDVVVVVESYPAFHLNIYSSENFDCLMRIPFPTDAEDAWNAVQTSTGTFIVSYVVEKKEDRNQKAKRTHTRLFTELMTGGTTPVRCFDLATYSSFQDRHIPNSLDHLSIDEDDMIFFTDYDKNSVYLLNSALNNLYVLLPHTEPSVHQPRRLCYVSTRFAQTDCRTVWVVHVWRIRSTLKKWRMSLTWNLIVFHTRLWNPETQIIHWFMSCFENVDRHL